MSTIYCIPKCHDPIFIWSSDPGSRDLAFDLIQSRSFSPQRQLSNKEITWEHLEASANDKDVPFLSPLLFLFMCMKRSTQVQRSLAGTNKRETFQRLPAPHVPPGTSADHVSHVLSDSGQAVDGDEARTAAVDSSQIKRYISPPPPPHKLFFSPVILFLERSVCSSKKLAWCIS